jgi:folate-binding protein YgfZ
VTEFDPVALLASGEGFADLSFWRKIALSGSEAGGWLQDLISADIADLVPGHARRSLLLSPTGRVRAEFTAALTAHSWLLLQDPTQPRPIDQLLAPYILSSDVVMEDRTEDLALFAFPGGGRVDRFGPATVSSNPSCIGSGGIDVIASMADRETLLSTLGDLFVRVPNDAVEEWRVRAGVPRFGVDALEDDLPQEAGLDEAVAFDKGCYLGQEAVAKVRNLGHPRRLVLWLTSDRPVQAGEPVLADAAESGVVTSAEDYREGSVLLARVRWEARHHPLRTASGAVLQAAPRVVQPSRPV